MDVMEEHHTAPFAPQPRHRALPHNGAGRAQKIRRNNVDIKHNGPPLRKR